MDQIEKLPGKIPNRPAADLWNHADHCDGAAVRSSSIMNLEAHSKKDILLIGSNLIIQFSS